jgi:Domain of unknown function (DUF5667)
LKFLSSNELQKLGRTTLALIIAGSFTFSTSLAAAAENTAETDEYQTVELPDTLDVPKANQEVNNEEKTKGEKVENEVPSLLPGSFFYFAKVVLEKIQLAFTFNQEKEAKLLATFAAERLAEAEALFKEGKEDEALKAIENAFESLEDVKSIAEDDKEISDDSAEMDEKAETEDSVKEELELNKGAVEVNVDDDVHELLSQNMIALTAAMEKVKNPKAKAALQKNIEKSYARLTSKIEKVKEKEKNTDVEETIKDTLVKGDESLTENTPTEKNIVPVKLNKQEKTVQKQEKKVVQEEAKIQKVRMKEEAKHAKKIEKQVVKQQKEELKVEKKLEKAQTKGNDKNNGSRNGNAHKEHRKNNGSH